MVQMARSTKQYRPRLMDDTAVIEALESTVQKHIYWVLPESLPDSIGRTPVESYACVPGVYGSGAQCPSSL